MGGAVLGVWWVWIAAAFVFGVIEIIAPGFIFLGFAIGALITAGLVGLIYLPSAAVILAVFATVSLLSWVGLRLVFRKQSSDTKTFTRDINDD